MIDFLTGLLDILKAIAFGIVEGITEWLPISSTGHLIILEKILKLNVSPEFYSMFQVVIQLGAILAVVVLFFRKLNPFDKGKNRKQRDRTWNLWTKVVVAVAPSAVLGLLLDDWLDAHLYNYVVVAITLIAYGLAFIYIEQQREGLEPRIKTVYGIDYKTALLIGCFQCLSLIPGTSRSGSTILGAIILGVSRSAAAEFSFFLGIPTMLGASLLKIVKFLAEGVEVTALEVFVLLIGCVVAFAVSLMVIQSLVRYVRNHSFAVFGVYRIGLGVVVLLWFIAEVLFFRGK